MVAKFDKEQGYLEKLNDRRRREGVRERQQEIQKEFLLEQIDELAADFVDHPEQIGHYIADLEAAGMLGVADKGMLFRRLWETMGPAFADRVFNMTERAVFESDSLARSISDDVAQERSDKSAFAAEQAERTVAPERAEELDRASAILLGLSEALGLHLDLAPTPPVREQGDSSIIDPDAERAAKTRELLDVLGPQLEVDTEGLEVRVDDEARHRTELQGLYGLMADGTVFLNPEVYDPETAEGRGLLAHEVSHIAQRENMLRGAGGVEALEPSIGAAEYEADNISEMFAQGGAVQAPLASLAMYDQAACGPKAMNEKPPEQPETPTTEVVVEPPIYEIVVDEIKVPNINFPYDEPGRGMQGKTAIDASGYGEQNQPILRRLIQTVATYPEITGIAVRSHTDHRGSDEYNQRLSERRAKATQEWLASPSDNGPALTVKITEAVGKGESEALIASQFKDGHDLTEAQHRQNRRSEFRITEVNGQPFSGTFKPTKKVLVQPGRTIVRYLDKDGNVIKEEVLEDGQQPAGLTPEEQPGANAGGPQAPQGQTGSGGGATTPTQATPSQTGQTAQPVRPSGQAAVQPASGGKVLKKTERVDRDKKVKVPYRYATASILGSVPQPGIHGAFQAKAGPGGLTSGTISERTRPSGGGEVLAPALKERFESAFGHDFSDVRIHRGSAAASSVGATAFARGTDIHFAPGRFDAASQSGLDVLGHELTHIVQQRAGRVSVPQNKGLSVNIDRSLESEADLLGARAARGERVSVGGSAAGLLRRQDTIQYEDGAGAAPATEETSESPPANAEIHIGGQKISARMPSGAQPGEVRVDFAGAEWHGVTLGGARLTFDSAWKIQRGTVSASVRIGEYVEADDVELSIERREVGGNVEGHVSANIRGARLNISELFDTTIDLTLSGDGVSGRATIDANAPITLGEGITLESGSLTVALAVDGTVTASGRVVGAVAGLGNVAITATAISDGHLSGRIDVTLAEPIALPGVEGVTIERVNIGGDYVSGESWTVSGGLGLNIRDWVGGDIQGTYTHPMGGGGGGGAEGGAREVEGGGRATEGGGGGGAASSSWTLNGTLTQLQPYTIGEGEDAVTLENGTLSVNFQSGTFVQCSAGVDWSTTNWQGRVDGTYKVQEQELDATGTILMKAEELALGDTGGRLTAVNGQVTIVANVPTELSGSVTAIFPYEELDTFEINGEGLKLNIPDMLASGSVSVRTMRDLPFGDPAAYNAKVAENASATLTVADNKLQGITGGLAFSVAYGEEPVGEGNIDVNFEGETNALNATATFTLSGENGFGVPDRVAGPVKLLQGGTFVLSIENSQLATAQVQNVGYEIKQTGEGATGIFGGLVNGSYDFRTSKLNVTGDGAVKAPWPLAPAEGVHLTFKEGGTISVTIAESKLTKVNGEFPFDATIDAKEKIPELVLEGKVNGDYTDETGKFSGGIEATLKQAVPIPMEGEGNLLTIKEGANIKATVVDSAPGVLEASFEADYQRAGKLFLNGNVSKSSYDFKSGDFDFTGSLTLKQDIEKSTEDGKWTFKVTSGATVGVEVVKSKLEAITGSIPFEVHDTDGCLLKGSLTDARLNMKDLKFSGTLDVALGRDLEYPRGEDGSAAPAPGNPPVSIVAKKDVSHVAGRIEENVFAELTAKLAFGVKLGGEEYGAGEVGGTWDVQANRFTGTGDIKLVKNLFIGDERKSAAGGTALESWILGFAAGQGLTVAVKNNVLDSATVNLGCVLFHNLEPVATGSVSGSYKLGETESFEGSANITVIKNLDFSEGSRFHYWIEKDTTAEVAFSGLTVNSASGSFRLLMKENEKDKVRVIVGASYAPGVGFNAAGQIEVLDDIPMAQSDDYKFSVAKGSGGGATVSGKDVTSFNGKLTVLVDKGQDPFAKGDFTLDYQLSDTNPIINATGTVELLSRVELGSKGEWKFYVMPSTGVSLTVANNELESLSGTVELQADKGVEPFAKLTLSGTYSKSDGFGGQAVAELLTEYKVIDTPIGGETYSLWVMPGTGATITLAGSDITLIGGQVIAMIRDGEGAKGNFIEVTAVGVSYGYKEKQFSGAGSAVVQKDKKLATFGEAEELWLAKGTGASASVSNNVLQQVGGNIQLKLKDATDFYITCGLKGSFDAAGGTGFTGQGSATITRQKKLGELGSYKFFLDEGAGATAYIEQNKLTKVDGNVPFQVHDEKGVLLKGQAKGSFRTEEKKFSGTGGVYLGRDIEYQVGTIKLVFKEGSGGEGTVTDNELRKLGGTLNVDIHDAEGPMINVNASGEFDAVEKKILWVEGGASLLRPISVGGEGDAAILRITTLTGSARVENNELKWCRGKLGFEAPRLLNMHGEVEGGWEATGGKDVFYGSGWVDFTIFDEPAQHRFMKGKADFQYNKDETWKIGGEIDYQLNEMIGGKVNVEVDQTLDPVLGGELRVENVKLVEGRDLFKWGKDFNLLSTTVMAGPVPIDINGGVGIGIALSMLPLTFSTVIGFSGWRPLSAATKVPDFSARADLNTGLRFTAALKPWFGIGLGVSGLASAGLRLQGEVALNVDANINPYAELKGVGGEYSGKLGVGVNIVGSGQLGITPQVYATLAKTWTYDLANITHDLGQLFSLDYNFAFPFGDRPGSAEAGGGGAAPPTPAAGQTKKIQGNETRPAMPAETQGSPRKPGATPGGPDLNQADKQEEAKSKQEGPMGELMQKIDSISAWGAKVGALAKVGGPLISMLMFMVTIPPPFGVALAGAYFAYQLLTGSITFDDIVTACKTVWEIVGLIGDAVLSALPDWLVNLWNKIKGKTWDQLLGDLIDNMSGWLIDLFPSARRIINALADMAKGILSDIAGVIRAIISGNFGFDDFIDLCRSIGGRLIGLIAELVGDAVVDAVEDAAGAVVDFICDPPW
ncbi:MAG: hypothetical protein CVU56_02635 [Deltaproteobacteria bacterium HGW-Deltaproteobacteria-14]|nr:MAG: hypothetical protein CVU56_02635 [Deltaproteobacteria bacterium HGW-Deltaproteobacteria-14]